MAKLTDDLKSSILADWHTGHFSLRQMELKHNIGRTTISKIVKGITPKHKDKVDTLIAIKTELSKEVDKEVDSVDKVVAAKTKHLQFLHNATLKNISVMVKKLDEDATIQDHKTAQDAIDKAGQTLGVIERFAPKQDINLTNAQQNNIVVEIE